MKGKLVQCLFIVLSLIVFNSCEDDRSQAGSADIIIKMVNKSNDLAHIFISSQGENFSASNKLAHNESRQVIVTDLVWDNVFSTYDPKEVVIKAGQNGVVLASRTETVQNTKVFTATFNGLSISWTE